MAHNKFYAICENLCMEETMSKGQIEEAITSPVKFKGNVATSSALPADPAINDTYYVQDLHYRVSWDGSAWSQSSSDGSEYDDAINELQEDVETAIDTMNVKIDGRIKKFYTGNLTAETVTDSDVGAIRNLRIYGRCEQAADPTPSSPKQIHAVSSPAVTVSGRNLLQNTLTTRTTNGVTITVNEDKTITLNGTVTANVNVIIGDFQTENGRRYKLTGTQPTTKGSVLFTIVNGVYYSDYNDGKEFTGNGQTVEVRYVAYKDDTFNNLVIKPMVSTDLTATKADYEPYKAPQVASLSGVTLNAIPVTSGGNVTIGGQQYIADYVDVEKKQIVRNCYRLVCNGSENWVEETQQSFPATTHLYTYTLPSAIKGEGGSGASVIGLCDILPSISTNIGNQGATTGIAPPKSKAYVYLTDNLMPTVAQWKTYLSTHSMTVVYKLATPTTESLTDEQVAGFLALRSYYPTTTAQVTSSDIDGACDYLYPCSLKNFVEYVKQQTGDTREFIYNLADLADQAFINAQYAEILAELSLDEEE